MIYKQSTACVFVILWVIYLMLFVRRNKRVVDYAQFQESDDAGKLL